MQPRDAVCSSIYQAGQLGRKVSGAIFAQSPLSFLGRKPGGVSALLLRRIESRHLAKMGLNNYFFFGGSVCPSGAPHAATFAANVAGKRCFLHPAMNSGLFKGLKGGGLRVRQPRFGLTFRKSPMTIVGSNQQQFDFSATNAVADGGHLIAFTQPPQLRQLEIFDFRHMGAQYDRYSVTCADSHSSRVHDAVLFWLEHILVRA